MKKYVIKISVVCVIVIVLLLMIVLVIRSLNEVEPSYPFLDGRSPVAYSELRIDEIQYKQKLYTYSFEGDFNDVCSRADAELIPDGFVCKTFVVENLAGNEFPCRSYRLKARFPRGSVFIYIYNNRQYTELPNPQKDALYMKEGWITVEIARGWRWPF